MTSEELKDIKERPDEPRQKIEWWPLSGDVENLIAEIEHLQDQKRRALEVANEWHPNTAAVHEISKILEEP